MHNNAPYAAAACYPLHYPFSHSAKGSFNFNICSSLYAELIRTLGVGVSMIPGIILNHDSLIYTRIGTGTFLYSKDRSYFTGGQLGIGLQSKISDNWSLRGEYIYTGSGIFTGFGNARFNLFNLALIYNLAGT